MKTSWGKAGVNVTESNSWVSKINLATSFTNTSKRSAEVVALKYFNFMRLNLELFKQTKIFLTN
jgi:hypothetical protein